MRGANLVAALVLLFLLGARAQQSGAELAAAKVQDEPVVPVTVGLLASENFPFSEPAKDAATTAPNHAGLEGFEVALMDAICQRANLNCTAVPLYNLEDRLTGVANGTLDLTISSLSFTPGREAVVQFVRPFYYSSGAALFADTSTTGLTILGPGGQPSGSPITDWRGVFTGRFPVGQTLCFVEGYYALPFVVEDLQVNIDVSPTLEQAAANVRNGRCAALVYDSVTPASVVGLPKLDAPSAYNTPYGVAVNKAAAGSQLEQRLVYALTGLMNQANASMILQLEKDWLVPNGVGPSSELQGVVDAVSIFGAPLSAGPSGGKVPVSYALFGIPAGGRKLLHTS